MWISPCLLTRLHFFTMATVGQRDYTHYGPLRKNPEYSGDELLDTIRDARPLTQEELDGDTIRFFQRNPARNEVLRNYVQNPLPNPKTKRFLAIGFAPLAPIVQSSANVDPLALRNALADAGVVLRKQNGRETVMRAQLRQLMPQSAFDVEYAAFDDGTNEGETTELFCPTVPLTQLADPGEPGNLTHDMSVEGDEQFELEIVFNSDKTSAIPSEDDLSIDMGAFVEIVPSIG
jgi:hypothetical protein